MKIALSNVETQFKEIVKEMQEQPSH